MKTIDTLVKDINDRITADEPFSEPLVQTFGQRLTAKLVEKLVRGKERPTLRMSNLGWPDRKLWYSINRPQLAEPLPASTRLKFLFGDIIEEVLLFLASASGHEVRHEQGKVEINGVRGSLDAIIDNELVDTKSASPTSFRKFSKHELSQDDAFGYRSQLSGYLAGVTSIDDTVRTDRAHFLVAEKVLGKLTLDTHTKAELGGATAASVSADIDRKREMLAWPTPPPRCYSDVPDGASGNRKLSVGCSYCPFKSSCWSGLRAFKYSKGPVFLTTVARTPDVPEISIDKATED